MYHGDFFLQARRRRVQCVTRFARCSETTIGGLRGPRDYDI
jgi:hypothetical protein